MLMRCSQLDHAWICGSPLEQEAGRRTAEAERCFSVDPFDVERDHTSDVEPGQGAADADSGQLDHSDMGWSLRGRNNTGGCCGKCRLGTQKGVEKNGAEKAFVQCGTNPLEQWASTFLYRDPL